MRTKFGTLLVGLGVLLIVGAIGLLFHNIQEQRRAGDAVESVLPQVVEAIVERKEAEKETPTVPSNDVPAISAEELPVKEMPQVEIDGNYYIGFLSLPSLEMEWPVMADWSYPKLQISPCWYYGNLYTNDLVIIGHNYWRHFRQLTKLRVGDTVAFTDMDAQMTMYEVVALDILEPTAVEELVMGGYDLSLVTCTNSGKSRLIVRCTKVEA